MQDAIRTHRHNDEKPFLVIWEVTQACDLACLHCRASAIPAAHPLALTRPEGEKLLRDIADFGKPHPLVVFTGGDPFKREDLFDLIAYSRELGLHSGVSPSATPLLTLDNLRRAREAGATTVSLSLDAPRPQGHDRFRGVEGSYERTLQGCNWVREAGLKLQINTTVTRFNLEDLAELAALVYQQRVMTWSLFSLVPTGRAQQQHALTADEVEAVMHFLVDVSQYIPLKTTEGHHFKRVLLMRQLLSQAGKNWQGSLQVDPLYGRLHSRWEHHAEQLGAEPRAAARRRPLHLNSGQGFMFISHLGHVFPSGFLPVRAGSVRQQSLKEIYQDSPLFRSLREPRFFGGRCGRCEFRDLCGGSRSRAYAVSGDPLGEDPACAYQPGSFPLSLQAQPVGVAQ